MARVSGCDWRRSRLYVVDNRSERGRGLVHFSARPIVIVILLLLVAGDVVPGYSASTKRPAAGKPSDTTRTVHIEGVLIDNSGGSAFDGIAVCAPEAIVQIQNCRILGLSGSYKGVHSDIVQPWGGVKELRIDRLTGSSDYQGLFIPQDLAPIGSTTIRRVDMTSLKNDKHAVSYLLWLVKGDGPVPYPITLEQVFVTPLPGQTVGDVVWPPVRESHAYSAVADGKSVSWPNMPKVRGKVIEGRPPQGDFVPDGAAGIGYVSPFASTTAGTRSPGS